MVRISSENDVPLVVYGVELRCPGQVSAILTQQ
jgi:hypothetical protein